MSIYLSRRHMIRTIGGFAGTGVLPTKSVSAATTQTAGRSQAVLKLRTEAAIAQTGQTELFQLSNGDETL